MPGYLIQTKSNRNRRKKKPTRFVLIYLLSSHLVLSRLVLSVWTPWGGGSLGSNFAGYVLLASQNPYPIIVYLWSILWPIIDLILVTFGHYSLFLFYYFLAKCRPQLSPFWANNFLNLSPEKVRPHSSNSIENA